MISPLLSLSWKDHSNSLTTACKTLLDKNFLVDCTIAAEGQCLKAHRLILSACSPYFQLLFKEEREKHPIVFLKDVSFDSVKAVINFVYHGEIEILETNLKGFLELAESLQIKGLNNSMKDRCKSASYVNVKDNPECSRDNQQFLEVQCTSATHKEGIEIAPEYRLHYSGDQTDAVETNSSVLLEGRNDSWGGVKSPRVVAPPSQEQHVSHFPIEFSVDTQTIVKEEPLHFECLLPKCEQTDEGNELCMQTLPHDNVCDLEEVGAPIFAEQNLHQYSSAAEALAANPMRLQRRRERPQKMTRPDEQLQRSSARADTSGSSLAQRKKTHARQRPFPCDVCGASFSQTSDVKRHQRLHTGERPFRCDVCGASFAQSSTLKSHQRTHTGERPFHCDVCKVSFSQLSTLKTHMRRHTGEKPFHCNVCGKSFTRNSVLFQHRRRHSKGNSTPAISAPASRHLAT